MAGGAPSTGPHGPGLDELDVMRIERACERLVKTYAHLNDAGRYDELVGLFAEDGVFARPTDPDRPAVGREAILALFQAKAPSTTRHLMANIVIDVDDGRMARGRSYVMAVGAPSDPGQPTAAAIRSIMVGAFEDLFVLTPDGWKIARRIGSVALKGSF